MRNRKFRLSDMIPNAWFHKLQEIGGGRGRYSNNQTPSHSKNKHRHPPLPPSPSKQKQPLMPPPPPLQSCSRKSYHFTRELESNDGFNSPLPPPPLRKSEIQHKPGRRRTNSQSSSPAGKLLSCRTPTESIGTKSDSPPELSDTSAEPEFRNDKFLAADSQSFDGDIVIDVSSKYSDNVVVGNFDSFSELDLPPIITKQKKKHAKQRTTAATSPTKKSPANSPGGVRLRNHSPRIGNRKISGRKSTSSRRSFSDSLAVMKSSYDPQKDFRESMVEMIVENNIRASKDLEDLLACYLCLNADEYHDLIIQVFKQIWFDLREAAL